MLAAERKEKPNSATTDSDSSLIYRPWFSHAPFRFRRLMLKCEIWHGRDEREGERDLANKLADLFTSY